MLPTLLGTLIVPSALIALAVLSGHESRLRSLEPAPLPDADPSPPPLEHRVVAQRARCTCAHARCEHRERCVVDRCRCDGFAYAGGLAGEPRPPDV